MLDRPGLVAGLAVVAGALAIAGMVLAGWPPAPRRAEPLRTTPRAAADFLRDWRTHLMASWSVDQVEERTSANGGTLRFTLHEAQRPPDRVRLGGGATEARRGDTLIACAVPPAGGHPACRGAPAKLSWQAEVDQQMAVLDALVRGPGAIYGVAEVAGCYDLILRDPDAVLPVVLGRGSQYCLDARTGAVLRSRVQRVGAVDRVTTVGIHGPAADADLALPPDVTYERR